MKNNFIEEFNIHIIIFIPLYYIIIYKITRIEIKELYIDRNQKA